MINIPSIIQDHKLQLMVFFFIHPTLIRHDMDIEIP